MEKYSLESIWACTKDRKPNFDNILKILRREKPDRYTLFEFFLHGDLEQRLAGWTKQPKNEDEIFRRMIQAFRAAGYDYVTMTGSPFHFHHVENIHANKASVSVNEGATIWDRESYEKYVWDEPEDYEDGRVERAAAHLPDGMKIIIYGPCGMLENITFLTGYDNLCYLLYDDPDLVQTLFDQIGERMIRYYEQTVNLDCVGAIFSNDDWGFNTQTMLPLDMMRKYVFPWHKKIAEVAHKAGKPVLLHSCGNLMPVFDDIIDDMKFDGKHSYEDVICPVEQMYDKFHDRIAVLGGIDVDYVCRMPKDDVFARSRAMLERTGGKGYGLGTGNSIAPYVPDEQYFAMIAAALYA